MWERLQKPLYDFVAYQSVIRYKVINNILNYIKESCFAISATCFAITASSIYTCQNIPKNAVFVIFGYDESNLEHMFLCKVCLSHHYLQFKLSYKFLRQNWLFSYSKSRPYPPRVNKRRVHILKFVEKFRKKIRVLFRPK